MTPALMKVYTSKLCTTMHTPEFEFLSGAETQYYESPQRLDAILAYLETHSDSFEITERVEDFGYEPIQRVHKQDFLDYLETAYEEWIQEGGHPNGVLPATIPHHKVTRLGKAKASNLLSKAGEYCFDLSAVITKDTFKAAWNAAQITLTATKDLVRLGAEYEQSLASGAQSRENPPGLYALVRPPGHHAQSDICGGYCFLNNVAIAAQWIIDQPELKGRDGQPKKIAIVDVDFHHGNGTQEIFYSVSNPLYTSMHSADDYPYFTGSALEKGEGEGLGFNVNIPLHHATTDDDYVEILDKLILDHVMPYQPDYVIVSLGVDTFKDDPIAGFLVTSEGYPRIGNSIRKIGVPTLFVQEGGYCVEKLGINVGGMLQGFLGKKV
ncbi:hypothetical protein EMPS_05122 [Entomortierella parvispora]|uniref:Histone deacetylase domain-containing protein n=1 Tax=Entomortierella parvispora TaxID=205924 RepID=A0A9P3H9R0_9FUNG|nr:hypothetical protein EMPS_05122 [Entomortierella parvispora]